MPGETYLRREGQLFIGPQTAWDAPKVPVASEAIRFSKVSIQLNEERESRDDIQGTRSMGATILGRRSATFSISGRLLPSGTAGTAPDIGELVKACLGTEALAGTSLYSLKKDLETTMLGLTITHFGNYMSMAVKNAIVQEVSVSASGGDHATFEASGEATDVIHTGSSTVATIQSAGNANVVVATGHGARYSIGSNIKVNGVGGHNVTSVTGDALVVTPAVVAAQVVGHTVVPDEPTGTTAGDPISKTKGSVTIGGESVNVLSLSSKITNNLKMRADEYGVLGATGFDSGSRREVSFETELRMLKSNFQMLGWAHGNTQKAIIYTIGNVTGKRLLITMPQAEIDPPSIENPEDDPAVFSLSGKALSSGAGDNEVTWDFN